MNTTLYSFHFNAFKSQTFTLLWLISQVCTDSKKVCIRNRRTQSLFDDCICKVGFFFFKLQWYFFFFFIFFLLFHFLFFIILIFIFPFFFFFFFVLFIIIFFFPFVLILAFYSLIVFFITFFFVLLSFILLYYHLPLLPLLPFRLLHHYLVSLRHTLTRVQFQEIECLSAFLILRVTFEVNDYFSIYTSDIRT